MFLIPHTYLFLFPLISLRICYNLPFKPSNNVQECVHRASRLLFILFYYTYTLIYMLKCMPFIKNERTYIKMKQS